MVISFVYRGYKIARGTRNGEFKNDEKIAVR